jgi:hypothetical protein
MLDTARQQEAFPEGSLAKSAPSEPEWSASNDYQARFFTPAEWQFLTSACDRLILHDPNRPGAVELSVTEFIDRQM